jgi:hypothetical protein
MSDVIKGCPFCAHGKGRVVTRVYDDGDTFGMSCNDCYIRMEPVYPTKEDAIRVWNIRAALPQEKSDG